jgi:hypothetical protein
LKKVSRQMFEMKTRKKLFKLKWFF